MDIFSVEDLIKELSKHDKDKMVYVGHFEGESPINSVELEEDYLVIWAYQ